MVDHTKIGRKSKNKGKAYERLVAKKLTDFTGINFRKTPGSGGFNKAGGVTVANHIFCGDLICDSADFIFSVEAKNRKGFAFRQILKGPETCEFTKWWFQTTRDAKEADLEPMLWFKPQAGSPDNLVVFREEFLEHIQLKNSPHISLKVYEKNLKFSIVEKIEGEKKKRKHLVHAKLPVPIVFHWSYIEKEWDPAWFFEKEFNINRRAIKSEIICKIFSYD